MSGRGKGQGKGGYRPDIQKRGYGFPKSEVEQACGEILKEERKKGNVHIDISTVVALLMSRFNVTELTELGCRYPNQIESLKNLSNLQATVMLLINLYRSEYKMGSLHECLAYVVRQAADLKITPGPVLSFDDLGVGPYQKHPELLKHFPGIEILGDTAASPFPRPPRVTALELFEAFTDVMKSRRKGDNRITPQRITDRLEKVKGHTIEELCCYATEHNLGHMVVVVGKRLRDYDNEQKAICNEFFNRKLKELRARQMGVTQEDIEEFDIEISNSMRTAHDIYNECSSKLRLWIETGESTNVIQRRMAAYLLSLKKSREVPVTDALIHSLLKYFEVLRECTTCNTLFDMCLSCAKKDKLLRANTTHHVEAGTVTVDELLSAMQGAVVSVAVGADAAQTLSSLEEETCGALGAGTFAELGCGSFLDFVVEHKEELGSEVQAWSAGSGGDSRPVEGERPPLREVLDTALQLLSEKKFFLRSWTVLNNLEVETPRRLEKTTWSEICAQPFTNFMKQNSKHFNEKGYEFLGGGKAGGDERGLVEKTIAAAFIQKSSSRVSQAGEESGGSGEAEEARLLEEHYGVRKVEDLGLGEKQCLLREVGEAELKDVMRVVQYPVLCELDVLGGEEEGEERKTAAEERAERRELAESCFEADTLGLLLEAAREPTGEDLASMLLWDELYAAEHGSLEEFLVKNAGALQSAGVKLLEDTEGQPKRTRYYAVVTGADLAAIDAAAVRRDYWELGVQLWSYLTLQGLASLEDDTDNTGDSGPGIEKLSGPVREALQAAAMSYTLPRAVCELLLATPCGLVRTVFGVVVRPVLDRIDSRWAETCAEYVGSHPMRGELLKRGVRLGLRAWVEARRKTLTEYPVFPKTTVVREAPVRGDGASATSTTAKAAAEEKEKKEVEQLERELEEEREQMREKGEGEVTEEELVIADIKKGLSDGENNKLTKILQQTLTVVATQLYESQFHFFFELIQNADDNGYPTGTLPTMRITLGPEGIEVLNNELGFRETNVRAVCNVNKSTKLGESASIGRKGIGFKAVFSVSDRPHIVSNGYNFFFSRTSCDLGLILPHMGPSVEPSVGTLVRAGSAGLRPLAEGEWVTRLSLPFKSELMTETFYEDCTAGANDVQSLLLLFLNTLRRIEVCNEINRLTRTLTRDDEPCEDEEEGGAAGSDEEPEDADADWRVGSEIKTVTLRQEVNGVVTNTPYVVYKQNMSIPEGVKSPGDKASTFIQVAFLKTDEVSRLELLPVTAFLPTNTKLFKFVLQADWTVNAARDRIVESEPWNRWLRNAAVEAILGALEAVKRLVRRGVLPTDYLMAALPDRELPRGDWFRPLCSELGKELRGRAILTDVAGVWVEPRRCVLLPEGLEADVAGLFPSNTLLKEKGLHYIAPELSKRSYRAAASLLQVHEMDAPLLVALLEKVAAKHSQEERKGTNEQMAAGEGKAAGATEEGEVPLQPMSPEWVARYLLCLRTLLQPIAGTSQEGNLLERVRRVAMIPVAGGGALAPATHRILAPGATTNTAAFMEVLNVVDKGFIDGCKEPTGLRAMLLKLGVNAAQKGQILECIKTDIAEGWERNGRLCPLHVASAAVWIGETYKVFDDETREVLQSLPLVCSRVREETRNLLLPPASSEGGSGEAGLHGNGWREATESRTGKVHLLVDAQSHHVMTPQGASGQGGFGMEWLSADPMYSTLARDKQALVRVLRAMGVREGVGGAYYKPKVVVGPDSEWMQLAKEVGVELPVATDGRYTLENDCSWPGVERVAAWMDETAEELRGNVSKLQLTWAYLMQAICTRGEALGPQLTTYLSYVPDWSQMKGFEGKIASESDRRRCDTKFPTTAALRLKTRSWVPSSKAQVERPSRVYKATEETARLLGTTVGYMVDTPDAGITLLQELGMRGYVSDEDLLAHAEEWYQEDNFETTIAHMWNVVQQLRGKLKFVWMPLERRPYHGMDDKQLAGAWYEPESCFVKAGQGGFLDCARTKYRYIGFVYKHLGYALGEIGVVEHAPWDVQLEGAESVLHLLVENQSQVGVTEDDVMALLKDADRLQSDVSEDGWKALNRLRLWWTEGLEYVSAERGTLLYNNLGVKVQGLPKMYRVLKDTRKLQLSEGFLQRCGLKPLSEVVRRRMETEEVPFSPGAYAYYTYAWRLLSGRALAACRGALCENEEDGGKGGEEVFEKLSKPRGEVVVQLVGSLNLNYEIEGEGVEVSGTAADRREVHLDETAGKLFVVVGEKQKQGDGAREAALLGMAEAVMKLVEEESLGNVVEKAVGAAKRELLKVSQQVLAAGLGPLVEELTRMEAEGAFSGAGEDGWYEGRHGSDFQAVVTEVERTTDGQQKNEVFGWVAAMVGSAAARSEGNEAGDLRGYELVPMREPVGVRYTEKGQTFFTEEKVTVVDGVRKEVLFVVPDTGEAFQDLVVAVAAGLGCETGKVREALEQCAQVTGLPQRLPGILLDCNRLLRELDSEAVLFEEGDIPDYLRAPFDEEEQRAAAAKAESRKRRYEAEQQAQEEAEAAAAEEAAAEEEAVPRVREAPSDPSKAQPTFGGTRSTNPSIVPNKEALDRANEAKKNWPSFQIPDEANFWSSDRHLGDKEGFEYRTGEQGLGYYRAQNTDGAEGGGASAAPTGENNTDSDEEVLHMPVEGRDRLPSGFIPGVVEVPEHLMRGNTVEAPVRHGAVDVTPVSQELGLWGEREALRYLREQEGKFFSVAEEMGGERYTPFDIVAGVTVEEFKGVSRNTTYTEVLRRYPDFHVYEVKTTKHDSAYVEMSWSEFKTAQELGDRYTVLHITCAAEKPQILKIRDPSAYANSDLVKVIVYTKMRSEVL